MVTIPATLFHILCFCLGYTLGGIIITVIQKIGE